MTKTDEVRKLMADGKPRSLAEIKSALPHLTHVSQIVSRLWRQGYLLATDIKTIVVLKKEGGKWKWSRSRQRWYVLANGRDEAWYEVEYMRYDPKLMENVLCRERLKFMRYEAAEKGKKGITQRVYECILESPVALFADEVAQKTDLKVAQVSRALHELWRYRKIKRSGWFNPDVGREVRFERGWLYYVRLDQYEARLAQRDVLPEFKQNIYDYILRNTKLQKRLTPAREIEEEFGLSKSGAKFLATVIKEISSVYHDLKKVEIGGEVFYYIDGFLSSDELKKEQEYWSRMISDKRSQKGLLGRAHEAFIQVGMDVMWNSGDFRISDYKWEFSIGRDGRKRYNVHKARVSNPRKTWEFDRVLHCYISPFSNRREPREIILVFEMKYRRKLTKAHWDNFIKKLADTYEFGCEITLKDVEGREVRVRIPRFNVVPIIVVPWKGDTDIEIQTTHGTRKVNFAQYVTMQGGLVLFTGEFENYLSKKRGKSVRFKRIFEAWLSGRRVLDKDEEKEFTKVLLEFLMDKN